MRSRWTLNKLDIDQLVEWMELERLCCPFFRFEIRSVRQKEAVRLHLTGPEGVKKFILDVLVKIECPKEPYPGEAESKGTKAAETLSYRKFPLRMGHHFRRR
jgi:hypothetical protein